VILRDEPGKKVKKTMINNDENHEIDMTSQDANRAKRRQLLKRGALLVPAIVTLHARPAHAQTNGSYGYNSYMIVNGQVQSVTGSWHTQQEARDADEIQNDP
tara:strand:- start:133 stop:438 length:306 start_codon:yes stop_codon:yes gene_type:complete